MDSGWVSGLMAGLGMGLARTAPPNAVLLNASQFPLWCPRYSAWLDDRPDACAVFLSTTCCPFSIPSSSAARSQTASKTAGSHYEAMTALTWPATARARPSRGIFMRTQDACPRRSSRCCRCHPTSWRHRPRNRPLMRVTSVPISFASAPSNREKSSASSPSFEELKARMGDETPSYPGRCLRMGKRAIRN